MATNRVQLHAELPWIDPLEAAALLPEGLLLHGAGQHPEVRCSYMGLNQVAEARLEHGLLCITNGDESTTFDDPLPALRRWLQEHRWNLDERHAFTGGFVGYVGYEFARVLEPTLPAPKEAPGTPDLLLHLCTDALVFDVEAQIVHLYVADEPVAAAKRLDIWQERLRAKPPSFAPPPVLQWVARTGQDAFEASVQRLRDRILDGDLFQANLATRFDAACDANPLDLFHAFCQGNPSPYMALLRYPDHAIVSSSPEQLFAVEAGRIRTRPIAGTRGRGDTKEADLAREAALREDPKERAEHTMLVDLLRNDIARVSRPGTTQVTEVMSVERYQHVMHLVSCVEGDVRPDTDFIDWMQALFPGGTITGAPKHRACLRIHEEEPVPRGPYTGSAGFLSWSHNAHWNILIRTLVQRNGQASVHAGSGIVADSVPAAEWKEAGRKAASLLRAGGQARPDAGSVQRHGAWTPPRPTAQVEARVLIVDNYDSFVHNLADYAAACGADVKVVRNDEAIEIIEDWKPSHLILGPGPGWPAESGLTLDLARALPVPTLGICLGHQALAEAHGGEVHVAPPVHGKTSLVHHDEDLFSHLPSPFTATRYHSLIVTPPEGWRVSAWLDDGTVMAMRHPNRPVWGLQFHPESLLTEGGCEIIRRFLAT
ncbi:MAG: chorismate-binding protein [Thermoplasmatota archaeon]